MTGAHGIPAGINTGHRDRHRYTAGVVVVWLGLLAPLLVSERRAASEIVADPVTPVTLFRGVTPVVCLLAAVMLLRPRLWPQHRGEWLAIAYISVAVASTLWSVAPSATVLKAGVQAAVFGLVIVLARIWDSVEKACGAVVTVAQGLVGASLAGAVVAPRSAFDHYYYWGGPFRLRGLLPEIHPVPLGWLALLALMGALSGLGTWRWQRRLPSRLLLACASLAALLLAQTRAAWAGAMIAAAAYAAMRNRKRLLLVLAGVLASSALVLSWMPTVWDRLKWILTRGQGFDNLVSLGDRADLWKQALESWMRRPLHGYGYYAGHRYGPYAEAFGGVRGDSGSTVEHAYIDGAYIETLVDLGILGVVPLALLALLAVRSGVRRVAAGTPSTRTVVALLIVASLLTDSLLSYSWQTPSYQGILLLLIVLAFHADEANQSLEPHGIQRGRRPAESQAALRNES